MAPLISQDTQTKSRLSTNRYRNHFFNIKCSPLFIFLFIKKKIFNQNIKRERFFQQLDGQLLTVVARKGIFFIIDFLLKYGVGINSWNDAGNTLFQEGVLKGNLPEDVEINLLIKMEVFLFIVYVVKETYL